MLNKLIDAAVPFYPENQTHLLSQQQLAHQQSDRMQFELYGTLWLYITMIVEFSIVGHF